MYYVSFYLIVVLIGTLLWWWYVNKKNKDGFKNIPQPPALPFFGNALDFSTPSEFINICLNYTNTYGDVVKFQIGPFKQYLLTSNYKMIEFILSSPHILRKSEAYDFLKSWLGSGLLIGSGPTWKQHRKILFPAFHSHVLEEFVQVFEQNSNKLVDKLMKQLDVNSFDVYGYINLCSLDIICESIMGTSINAQDDANSEYTKKVRTMCRIIVERSLSIIQQNEFLYTFTQNYSDEKAALKVLHAKSNDVIDQRRKNFQKKYNLVEESSNNTKKKQPFLDLLLQTQADGKPLSQHEIREEVDTFMFAGHDTTSTAVTFALYCLANNPEIQQKAFVEQKTIFEDSLKNGITTYTKLENMKYLELVIKETLRLYPPVPIIGRKPEEDITYDDTILPRDSNIIMFIFGIHRNPKYFKDPEVFNPNRFESIEGNHPFAYIPFSAGRRNCIGQKFAMLEMKSIISKVLRNYELLPAVPTHHLKLVAETVLKSTTGIKIRLKKRNI